MKSDVIYNCYVQLDHSLSRATRFGPEERHERIVYTGVEPGHDKSEKELPWPVKSSMIEST